MKKKYFWFALPLVLALVFDQASKIWARAVLKPEHRIITVIDGLWDFRYSENRGSAFGLFTSVSGARYFLLLVGLVALGIIFTFLRRISREKLRLAAELGLLTGGAFGNLIERVWPGRVTDFIVWKFHGHEWPTFNIADAALVVGIIALFLDARSEDFAKPNTASSAPAPVKKPRK